MKTPVLLAVACLLAPMALADPSDPTLNPTLNPMCPFPEENVQDVEPGPVLCIDNFRNATPLLPLVKTTQLKVEVQAYGYSVDIPPIGTFGIPCAVASVTEPGNPTQEYAPCLGTRGNPIGPRLIAEPTVPLLDPGVVAYLVQATLKAYYEDLGVKSMNILVVCPTPTCGSPLLVA